jgi:hypothetical protein
MLCRSMIMAVQRIRHRRGLGCYVAAHLDNDQRQWTYRPGVS